MPLTAIQAFYSWSVLVLSVVWHCRVSFASCAFGFLLMAMASPVWDLLADRDGGFVAEATLVGVVLLFWAFPVYLSARNVLLDRTTIRSFATSARIRTQNGVCLYRRLVCGVPIALGLACILAICFGVDEARVNFAAADFPEAAGLLPVLSARWWWLATGAGLYLVVAIVLSGARRRPQRSFRVLICLSLLVLVCLVVVPDVVPPALPRATTLILLLGAIVAPLTALQKIAQRVRLPVVFMSLAAVLVLAGACNTNRIRLLPAVTTETEPSIEQAVRRWKEANGCSASAKCPHPIIVAAQGGGSRAAFFTASVLGGLLDTTRSHAGRFNDFGRQLFAISSVSGSSMAAAITRAALEDAGPAAGSRTPPCRRSDSLWFASVTGSPDPTKSWRGCLEAIAAGDFLSPVIVGLMVRDHIPVGVDRAQILEQVWERRYRRLTGRDTLAQPFGTEVARRLNATGEWLPLLFLNATSLSQGRRIVGSELRPFTCAKLQIPEALFPESFALSNLLESDPGDRGSNLCRDGSASTGWAVGRPRLSTAAVLSARFPVISPPAAIWLSNKGPTEYVVDGGYFDNDGLATAAELARFLKEQAELEPVILHIRNEPLVVAAPGEPAKPPFDAIVPQLSFSPPLPRRIQPSYLAALEVPLLGLNRVRGAHFFEYERQSIRSATDFYVVSAWARPPPPSTARLFEPAVSWWVSPTVQAYLHREVDNSRNAANMEEISAVLQK